MRTIITFVAVLSLAAPAAAEVTIEIVDLGAGVVAINYSTDGEKVRAFALDITVDAGVIEEVFDYHVGPSTAADPGYGIFPGSFARYISVDPQTGEVETWDVNDYTPVADPCTTGALGRSRHGGNHR